MTNPTKRKNHNGIGNNEDYEGYGSCDGESNVDGGGHGDRTNIHTLHTHKAASAAAATTTATTTAALQLLNLKPLRDLAQNFDIDIASCLNDYLTELDQEELSSSPNNSSNSFSSSSLNDHHHINHSQSENLPPNFTEAALLLQNSSGVYSRKVEYLHTLVYKTLHSLIEQTNNQFTSNSDSSTNKSGRGRNSNRNSNGSNQRNSRRRYDEDIAFFEEYDPELQFLLLDDVLPVDKDGGRINLKQKHLLLNDNNSGDQQGFASNMNTNIVTSDNNSSILNATRLSIGGILDDYSCENNSSSSGSSRAAVDAANMGFANTMLRLMNGACSIHPGTGALLMPGTTTTIEDGHNNSSGVNINKEKNNEYDANADDDNDHTDNDHRDAQMDYSMEKENSMPGEADKMEEGQNQRMETDVGNALEPNGFDDDGDDDDGNGFVLNDDHNSVNNDDEIHVQNHQRTDKRREVTASTANPSPLIQDPWEMILDPQDNSKSKIRPMKLGKTVRLPQECNELPSDAVTGSRTKVLASKKRKQHNDQLGKSSEQKKDDKEDSEWWNKCIATHSYNATITLVKEVAIRRQSLINQTDSDTELDGENGIAFSAAINPIPVKGHLFSNEFSYIAKEQLMRKAIEQRKKNRQEKVNADGGNSLVDNSVAAAITNERFRDMYEGDDDFDNGEANNGEGPIDFVHSDYNHGDDDDDGDDFCCGDDLESDENNAKSMTLQHFDRVFSTNNVHSSENVIDNESSEQATFEELCRAHLKEFSKGAERYAVETQLSKRVGEWQSKLADILVEEEERPEFDIKIYSERILKVTQKKRLVKRIGDNRKISIPFVEITKNQDVFDVSRTFLASLMLCNTENMAFCNARDSEVSDPESLEVKLLKLELDSPMDDFLAPSVLRQSK